MSTPYYWPEKKGWFVYFVGADGKRKRKLLAKTKAEAFRNWREMLESNRPNSPDKLFSVVAGEWLLRQKSRFSKGEVSAPWLARVTRTIESFTAKQPRIKCGSITETVVTEWLGPDAASSYEHSEVSAIKQVLRWAKIEAPILAMRLSKGKRREIVLTLEQHERLVEAARSSSFKNLLRLAWLTGARPGELRSLKWEHVSIDNATAVLVEHKTAKQVERPRVLYFNTEAQRLLSKLRKLEQSKTGHVFTNRIGKPFTKDAIVGRMTYLQDKTGIKVTAYAYRHSYATRALIAGESASTVAELLGTSAEMITKVYGHLNKAQSHLRDAANRI